MPGFPRYENGKPVEEFKPADDAPGLAAQQRGFADTPREWRVERYLELQFTHVYAELLADARDSVRIPDRKGAPRTWTFPLYWGRVAQLLELGASHDQVVAIYA